MAYGNGRSSFWRKKRSSEVVEKWDIESQRPMLMEEVPTKMAQSNWTLDPLNFETAHFLVETDWFYRIEEIIDLQVEGNVFWVRVMEVYGLLGLTSEEESGEDRQQDVRDAISSALCSVDLGLRHSVHALNVSEFVVPETLMNIGSPIWHMNRLWENNMMEDWRVLELPNAESREAPESDQVGEVGNVMIMAEVGELGLEIPIEVLGPSERSMELIDVGPRSEVPRAGKAVTIELNGKQCRIRQLFAINLSILSPVERCEAERRLHKKGRGRPRKKPLPEHGIANASLSDSDFIQREQVILREARETLHLGRLIGAETVGNEEDIVKDIARIIEARVVQDEDVVVECMGLGTAAKRHAVQKVIRQHRCELVLLQKMKLEVVTDVIVRRIWISDNFEYVFSPTVGRSGGILVIWDKERFRLSVSSIQFRFVVVEGYWYCVCTKLARACFQHVYREANSLADALVKGGVERSSWFQVLGS
ncbi:hypothetical protein V6N13_131873 [Hibiscus sabdariffa]